MEVCCQRFCCFPNFKLKGRTKHIDVSNGRDRPGLTLPTMEFSVMEFDGQTSTPTDSRGVMVDGSMTTSTNVKDPFDFDPFLLDPFNAESFNRSKATEVFYSSSTADHVNHFGDSFDPFNVNPPTRSSTLIDDALTLVAITSGPVTSSYRTNGAVSGDCTATAFGTSRVIDETANRAFVESPFDNGLLPTSRPEVMSASRSDVTSALANWSADWSCPGVTSGSGAVEALGDDGTAAVCQNGRDFDVQVVTSTPVPEAAVAPPTAPAVTTLPSQPASTVYIQSPSSTSDGNGYALTDAIDDMLAAEFPEAAAPTAELEDELMTPIKSSAEAEDDTAPTVADVINVDSAVNDVHASSSVADRRPSACGSLAASRRASDAAKRQLMEDQLDYMDAEQAGQPVAETRLILCGPLQIMGRSDLHPAQPRTPTDDELPTGATSPAARMMSEALVHFPVALMSPSTAAAAAAAAASSSIDAVEASILADQTAGLDDDDEQGKVRLEVPADEAAAASCSGSSHPRAASRNTTATSEDDDNDITHDLLMIVKPIYDDDNEIVDYLDALPETAVDGGRDDVGRIRIEIQPLGATLVRYTAADGLHGLLSDGGRKQPADRFVPTKAAVASLDGMSMSDGSYADNQSVDGGQFKSGSKTNLFDPDDDRDDIEGRDDGEGQGGADDDDTDSQHGAGGEGGRRDEDDVTPTLGAQDGVPFKHFNADDSIYAIFSPVASPDEIEKRRGLSDDDDLLASASTSVDPQLLENGAVKVYREETTETNDAASVNPKLGRGSWIVETVSAINDHEADSVDADDLEHIDHHHYHHHHHRDLFDESFGVDHDDDEQSTSPGAALDSTDDMFLNNKTMSDQVSEFQLDALCDQQVTPPQSPSDVEGETTWRQDEDDETIDQNIGYEDDGDDNITQNAIAADDDDDADGYVEGRPLSSSPYSHQIADIGDEVGRLDVDDGLPAHSVQYLSSQFGTTQLGCRQSGIDHVTPSISNGAADASNTCRQCGKRVYEMEKMTTNQTVYHKTCFRCSHCRRVLSLANFACMEGHIYCKPHFLEIFMTKGKYDDSFVISQDQSTLFPIYGDNVTTVAPPSEQSRVVDNGDDKLSLRNPNDITLVPIHTVRGIYEKLSRDAVLSKAADVLSPKRRRQDDDLQQQQQQQPRRSSIASADSRSTCDEQKMKTDTEKIVIGLASASPPPAEPSTDAAPSVITCSLGGRNSILPEEMPPPQFTKHLLERFRQLEGAMTSTTVQQQQQQQPKAPTSLSRAISAPSTPVRRRAPSALHHDAVGADQQLQPLRHCQQQQSYASSTSPSPSPFDNEVSMSFSVSGADELVLNMMMTVPGCDTVDSGGDLPHRGLTKALLAQWRNIEGRLATYGLGVDVGTGRGRASMPTTNYLGVVAASRSQSMPRMPDPGWSSRRGSSPCRSEVLTVTRSSATANQRDALAPPATTNTAATVGRIPSMSDGSVDSLPPPLMTQYMLAKFRDMEAESQIVSGLQAPSRKPSFKWEVKESTPLNHGIDTLQRSPSKSKQQQQQRQSMSADAAQHGDEPEAEIVGVGVSAAVSSAAAVATMPSSSLQANTATDAANRDSNKMQQQHQQHQQQPVSVSDVVPRDDLSDVVDRRRDELPEPGTARILLARFQSMQSKYQ